MNKEKNFLDALNDWGSILTDTYEDSSVFRIPSNMPNVPDGEFDSIKIKEKRLLIGKHVKTIGRGSFADTDFVSIEFEEGCQLTSIGDFAFKGCKHLTGDLLLPDTVEYVGEFAFMEARFNHVNIPTNLKSFTTFGLVNLNFDEFIIPPSVELIQLVGMSRWTINHDLVIPPTVKTLEISSFKYLNVKTVYVPYGIKLPENVKSITDDIDQIQVKRYHRKNYEKILNQALMNKYN